MSHALPAVFLLSSVFLVGCGVSEIAEQAEQTAADLSAKLESLSGKLPQVVEGVSGLVQTIDVATANQRRLENIGSSLAAEANTLGLLIAAVPPDLREEIETIQPDGTVSEAAERHNEAALALDRLVRGVQDSRGKIDSLSSGLASETEQYGNVIGSVTDNATRIGETTADVAETVLNASDMVNDLSDDVRQIQERTDLNNIVGGFMRGVMGATPLGLVASQLMNQPAQGRRPRISAPPVAVGAPVAAPMGGGPSATEVAGSSAGGVALTGLLWFLSVQAKKRKQAKAADSPPDYPANPPSGPGTNINAQNLRQMVQAAILEGAPIPPPIERERPKAKGPVTRENPGRSDVYPVPSGNLS